jgi:hypothetical protein
VLAYVLLTVEKMESVLGMPIILQRIQVKLMIIWKTMEMMVLLVLQMLMVLKEMGLMIPMSVIQTVRVYVGVQQRMMNVVHVLILLVILRLIHA